MRKQERAEKRRRLEKEEESKQQREMEIVKALMELDLEKRVLLWFYFYNVCFDFEEIYHDQLTLPEIFIDQVC